MRWNLLADYGEYAADRFLACYEEITGNVLTEQAYWDLASLFDVLLVDDEPGDVTPADLHQFEDYARTGCHVAGDYLTAGSSVTSACWEKSLMVTSVCLDMA